MGYRAQKLKAEEKEKLFKRVALCIFAVLLLALVTFSFFVPPESWRYYFAKPKVGKRGVGELRIHFIDVGQGDCTLIELPDGKRMLIDGGDDSGKTKKSVMRYLNALDIQTLDYLVVTHTDGDHCGSLEEVFRYKKVLNAYIPRSFAAADVEYAETYAAAVREGCTIIEPSLDIRLSTEAYTLAFLYPYAREAQDGVELEENERSAVLWVDYQGVSALFCGDAPSRVEKWLVEDDQLGLFANLGVTLSDTEILKVAHHGSKESTSQKLLDYLGVESAVVSCGKENGYGHPSKEALDRLLAAGAEVYRTDLQGHILATIQANGSYRIAPL